MKLNPPTLEKEFGGTLGAVGVTLGLPSLVVLFFLLANENYVLEGVKLDIGKVVEQIQAIDWKSVAFDCECWKFYLKWFFGLMALDFVVPGKKIKGIKLRDGTQLDYNINGLPFTIIVMSIALWKAYSNNWYLAELEFLYTNFLQLALVSTVFSFIFSTFLYAYSFVPLLGTNGLGTKERILSINGNSRSAFYNWFIGRELNPRIVFNRIDLKLFCELKPGLLLWFFINLSCLHHYYWTNNGFNDALILVNCLEAFYVFDGVLNEEGVVSMMDITTDGFGFMLVFGDLTWVPFSYSLQARYLALHPVHLGTFNWVLIASLMALGFYIFRSSNKQKSDWKMGLLDTTKYSYIQTDRGTKLLCDGWWKYSQHMNYFGDWLISWSWCLPTGFNTPLTYFYVIYFGVLLVHRQTRDEAKCAAKYGKAWVEYTQKVPYKIVPYVY